MIVSFRHSFVFIAIPKTGSQALRACLRPHLAANDWEQCTLLEQRFFPVQPLAEIGHGHIEWRELMPFLLPGQWERMTSFAVVRCPFRRFESFARFAFREEGDLPADHAERLKAMLSDPVKREHILLRPQHRFVCDDAGTIKVSMILRHEQMVQDMAALSARLGLALEPMAHINASPRGRSYQPDAELLAMIQSRYADDFRIFGFDNAEHKN
jgi:hypothetical protein